MTEKELIDRIKIDPKEFSILFEEYYKPIFGYVLRRTADFEKYDFIDGQQFNHYIEEDRKKLNDELLKHSQYQIVVTQLKIMPIKYQELISLRFFESKTNREISEILNIKEGTVKSLISRGLEKLREKCNEL